MISCSALEHSGPGRECVGTQAGFHLGGLGYGPVWKWDIPQFMAILIRKLMMKQWIGGYPIFRQIHIEVQCSYSLYILFKDPSSPRGTFSRGQF